MSNPSIARAVEAVQSAPPPVTARDAEAIVRVAPRELERRFVRLGTGVAKEHTLGKRRAGQPFREAQRRLFLDAALQWGVRAVLLVCRASTAVVRARLGNSLPTCPHVDLPSYSCQF